MAEIVLLGAGKYIPRDRFRYQQKSPEIVKRPIAKTVRILEDDNVQPITTQEEQLPTSNQLEIPTLNDNPSTNLNEAINSSINFTSNADTQPITINNLETLQTKKRFSYRVIDYYDQVLGKLKSTPATLKSRLSWFKSKINYNYVIGGFAVLLIGLGLYMMFSGVRDNAAVHTAAVALTKQANKDTSTVATTSHDTPTTVKPSPTTYSAYAVSPDMPKYLRIAKLGVNARVLQVGILADGSLGTPRSVFDTAWYTGSSKPGQPGATLIDGHVSSWTAHGVFYGLKTLVAGDSIQVVKGDNSVVNYEVVKSQVYSANNVDMQAAVNPVVPGTSGLNLITCTGQVIRGTSEFNQRIIVFAKQV